MRNPDDPNSGSDWGPYCGQWVVLHDGAVIACGPELKVIVDKAHARGMERPRVLFVEGRDPETVKLGL
jgi:hypothetical protein